MRSTATNTKARSARRTDVAPEARRASIVRQRVRQTHAPRFPTLVEVDGVRFQIDRVRGKAVLQDIGLVILQHVVGIGGRRHEAAPFEAVRNIAGDIVAGALLLRRVALFAIAACLERENMGCKRIAERVGLVIGLHRREPTGIDVDGLR